jgi:hypothetical protein
MEVIDNKKSPARGLSNIYYLTDYFLARVSFTNSDGTISSLNV